MKSITTNREYLDLLSQFYHHKNTVYIKVVVINFILILLVLNGFEYYVRPEPEHDLPQNGMVDGKQYTWGYLVVNNQFGFREREFERPKPEGVFRIMVLGDSLTWGAGLSTAQRYTTIAEEYLNQSGLGIQFEVLSFAESSGPTTNERDLLNRLKDVVQPDLIVVGFCLNDPQPKSQDYSVERSEYFSSTIYGIIYNISIFLRSMGFPYLGKMVDEGTYRLVERSGIVPTWQVSLQRTYELSSKEWQDFVQALEDIKTISDDMHLQQPIFTILNQSVYLDRPTDYNQPDENLSVYLKWYHQAEVAARKVGFRSYNHEREIALNLNNEPLSVNRYDGHPSANLNKLYGEKLSKIIAEKFTSIIKAKKIDPGFRNIF